MSTYRETKDLPILWRDTAAPSEYEEWRTRVYNARLPDRYPVAIARPGTVEEVQAVVKLAAELQLRVAVRSGGHSWACWSIRDGSILIDLVNLKHLSYDKDTDTLEASPSTLSVDAVAFAWKHGRFLPMGHTDSVGLGGFLLQGGWGFNSRGYGWACEYLKSIDVVTADGVLKHCDKNENSELFWAARGSGPGFPGIVTKFSLKTRPAQRFIKKIQYVWPISDYDACMKWVLEVVPELHVDVEAFAFSMFRPDFEDRVFLFWATAFGDSPKEAMSKLKQVKDTHPPNTLQSLEYTDMDLERDYALSQLTDIPDHKERWVCDTAWIKEDIDFVTATKRFWVDLPEKVMTVYTPIHLKSARSAPDMAVSLQTNHYLALYATYQDPDQDEFHIKWMADSMHEMEKVSVGAYMGDADFQVRPTRYWSDEAGRKLATIRKMFDPTKRFCGYLTKDDQEHITALQNVVLADERVN